MTLIKAKQSYYSNPFNSEINKLIVSFKGDFNNYMSTNREPLNAKSSPVFLRNVKYVLGQSIIYYFRLMSSNKLTVQAGMKHITFQYNCSCFNSCFYNAHQ